jgi:flagellar basal body-associated protein FliL
VATICGLASSRADLGFDPVKGDAPKKSDKLLWLILFAPALVLLGAVSVYTALHARDGFDVFKAGLTAGMFGWVLGLTLMLLGAGSRVTAKIGEG